MIYDTNAKIGALRIQKEMKLTNMSFKANDYTKY